MLGAYLLRTPFALMGMPAGRLLGPLGVILFSLVIWAVFMAIGYFIGRLVARRGYPAL